MLLTIEALRAKAGIDLADDRRDVEITKVYAVALSMIESYTNRKLEIATETETIPAFVGSVIMLRRYPITEVSRLTAEPGWDIPHVLDHEQGMIHLRGAVSTTRVTVTYTGGYETLPADLEMALLAVFSSVIAGNETSELAGLKQINVTGVGSLAFGDESSSSPISGITKSVLDAHRRFAA